MQDKSRKRGPHVSLSALQKVWSLQTLSTQSVADEHCLLQLLMHHWRELGNVLSWMIHLQMQLQESYQPHLLLHDNEADSELLMVELGNPDVQLTHPQTWLLALGRAASLHVANPPCWRLPAKHLLKVLDSGPSLMTRPQKALLGMLCHMLAPRTVEASPKVVPGSPDEALFKTSSQYLLYYCFILDFLEILWIFCIECNVLLFTNIDLRLSHVKNCCDSAQEAMQNTRASLTII